MKSPFTRVVETCQQWFVDASRTIATASVAAALLAACGGSGSDHVAQSTPGAEFPASDDVSELAILMQVEVPARIGALRDVDLEYTIELKGAGIVSRVNPGAPFNVPFNATGSARYYYRIEIREPASGLLIAIREGSKWLDTDQTLLVSSDHYQTSGADFDPDGDGISNLQELEDELNPGVPETTRIDFSFRVADWVQSLHDAGFVRFETVVDSLANNNGKFAISYNQTSEQYEATGFGLEVGGQPRDIGISMRVAELPYHFNPGGLALAFASRLMTLRNGVNDAHFEWSDFNSEWDLDRDGTTNLEELRRGTSPVSNGPEYIIPVIAGGVAPVIDGDLQDMSWHAGGNTMPLDAILLGTPAASDNPSERFFTAVHDFTNLYLGVQIQDHTIVVDSAEQHWQDDSIEIYIDGDNSRLDLYDGNNDLALNFRFADASAQSLDVVAAGSGSIPVPANLQYRMTHDFSRGLTQLEISLPLIELGIDIHSGMGLDVQYNDDDDSGDRNRKYGWRGPDGADNAWMNPTWFGEIEFSN